MEIPGLAVSESKRIHCVSCLWSCSYLLHVTPALISGKWPLLDTLPQSVRACALKQPEKSVNPRSNVLAPKHDPVHAMAPVVGSVIFDMLAYMNLRDSYLLKGSLSLGTLV